MICVQKNVCSRLSQLLFVTLPARRFWSNAVLEWWSIGKTSILALGFHYANTLTLPLFPLLLALDSGLLTLDPKFLHPTPVLSHPPYLGCERLQRTPPTRQQPVRPPVFKPGLGSRPAPETLRQPPGQLGSREGEVIQALRSDSRYPGIRDRRTGRLGGNPERSGREIAGGE